MSKITIIQGDSQEKLKGLADNSVDSICCDPPYGLSFMGKKWDYDVPSSELWVEVMRVLKPGGHLLSFAGSRTYHRMAVNIEDAGFEIRDQIMWVYGVGFPKSHNIGKSVDKLQGNEREVIGKGQMGRNLTRNGHKGDMAIDELHQAPIEPIITKGSSPYEGWGTALKPAHEPIVVARKPLSEKTIAKNVLEWGTGGINIDGCRVGTEEIKEANIDGGGKFAMWNKDGDNKGFKRHNGNGTSHEQGRFPANFIHDGSDEVVGLFPETHGAGTFRRGKTSGEFLSAMEVQSKDQTQKAYDNGGSAARFFYCAKASKKDRNEGLGGIVSIMVQYEVWNEKNTTKQEEKVQLLVGTDKSVQKVTGVSGLENKNGTAWNTVLFGNSTMEKFLEVNKSITSTTTNLITKSEILNWLVHSLTNEYTVDVNCEMMDGGNLVASANESNTLITTINEKMASALGVKNVVSGTQLKISVSDGSNFHSTVKPTALMQYLVRLVTPKGGTCLDPFMGSGSTGKACKLEGFEFIGIELDPEYCKIAKARIKAINQDHE